MKRSTVYKSVISLIFIGLVAFIGYQQAQIDELATRVYGEHNMSDSDSFDYRITNLEHISNNHAARLKTLEKEVWLLKKQNNALQWRIMQLEWIHPELAVPQTTPISTDNYMKDFDPDPGKVPSPLNSGESIFKTKEQYKGQ